MSVCKGRVRAIDKKAFETYWYRISGLEPYYPGDEEFPQVQQGTQLPLKVIDLLMVERLRAHNLP